MAMDGHASNGHAEQHLAPAERQDIGKSRVQAEALKEQLVALDAKREHMLKSRPSGVHAKRSMQEVEALIRAKQHEMEWATLTIKEEKAKLLEMKRMKDDAKKAMEWENEFDEVRNRRAALSESLRAVFADIDSARDGAWRAEAAEELGVPLDALVDRKIPVSEEERELLSSARWRKKLKGECGVVVRGERGAGSGVGRGGERGGASVRLAGLPEGIETAEAVIRTLGPVGVQRIKVLGDQTALLIGRNGSTINQLQESSGCSIEVRKKDGVVVVVGPALAVSELTAEIQLLFITQKRVEITLKFDPEQKGTLLGKGGATIQRIQDESGGATLEIGRGGESSVKVMGPAVAVEAARAEICKLLLLDAECVRSLEVPEELVNVVIGRGGDRMRSLADRHGVAIGRLGDTGLRVRGSRAGVDAALAVLQAAIEANRHVEEALEIESQHVGMLLGKGGVTINAIQRETGATIGLGKLHAEGGSKADAGSKADGKMTAGAKPSRQQGGSGGGRKAAVADGGGAPKEAQPKETQKVIIKGTREAVHKAMAALESVLQYKAEATETVRVDPSLMPFVIGKGGEEINRIRAVTGAAIDVAREQQRPEFCIRGTADAVAAAKRAIEEAVESNRRVSESATLPWHCIDVVLGPSAERLRTLETDHQVLIELPGTNLASENVCSGTFLAIGSSMTLRGRKKHVESAMAELAATSRAHLRDELDLCMEDCELLARLCLQREELLPELEARFDTTITFEPLQNRLIFRGEGYVSAQIELQHLIGQARPQLV